MQRYGLVPKPSRDADLLPVAPDLTIRVRMSIHPLIYCLVDITRTGQPDTHSVRLRVTCNGLQLVNGTDAAILVATRKGGFL